MNCIIVDDDVFSTRLMAELIKRTSALDLVNTFTNAIDAVDYMTISKDKIDLIFLDIEMPEMSGIDFMKAIETHTTQIIIYSSQEKYALQSYEYNVCDYLLKPVNYTRFIKAVNKAQIARQMSEIVIPEDYEKEDKTIDVNDGEQEIYLKDNSMTTYKVRFNDIIYVEASENYVTVVTTTRSIMIHSPLKKILEKLPEKFVIRVHRSYAIGVRFIKDIIGCEITLLLTEKRIPIGKSFRPSLNEILKNIVRD
ncbi:MAG: LytTR family DNA-binding domain-containing protein [Bacteroidales bacterium]|nr:LytTR family DNA-binding domain-containing protein [Bacteroidales bacterium]